MRHELPVFFLLQIALAILFLALAPIAMWIKLVLLSTVAGCEFAEILLAIRQAQRRYAKRHPILVTFSTGGKPSTGKPSSHPKEHKQDEQES